MAGFQDLAFRGQLDPAARKELELLTAQQQGQFGQEHDGRGRHTIISERGRTLPLGTWADVPFLASDYTASGTMLWTIARAQQFRRRYALVGLSLWYAGKIQGTNVAGVAAGDLRIALPSGLTFPDGEDQLLGAYAYVDAGGALTFGHMAALAGTRYLTLRQLAGGNWTLTAGNNTSVYFFVAGAEIVT